MVVDFFASPEGSPGAAARGLKCWVHDVDFLTCSWEVGMEAPSDIQYHGYLEAVTYVWPQRGGAVPGMGWGRRRAGSFVNMSSLQEN